MARIAQGGVLVGASSIENPNENGILSLVSSLTTIPLGDLVFVGKQVPGEPVTGTENPGNVQLSYSDLQSGGWTSDTVAHFIIVKGGSGSTDTAVYEYPKGAFGGVWDMSEVINGGENNPDLSTFGVVAVVTRQQSNFCPIPPPTTSSSTSTSTSTSSSSTDAAGVCSFDAATLASSCGDGACFQKADGSRILKTLYQVRHSVKVVIGYSLFAHSFARSLNRN